MRKEANMERKRGGPANPSMCLIRAVEEFMEGSRRFGR